MSKVGIDKAFFGLVYHDSNLSIKKEWESYYNLVAEQIRTDLFSVAASKVLSYSTNNNQKKYFKDRYLIPNRGSGRLAPA